MKDIALSGVYIQISSIEEHSGKSYEKVLNCWKILKLFCHNKRPKSYDGTKVEISKEIKIGRNSYFFKMDDQQPS